jgi:hypothetical protein
MATTCRTCRGKIWNTLIKANSSLSHLLLISQRYHAVGLLSPLFQSLKLPSTHTHTITRLFFVSVYHHQSRSMLSAHWQSPLYRYAKRKPTCNWWITGNDVPMTHIEHVISRSSHCSTTNYHSVWNASYFEQLKTGQRPKKGHQKWPLDWWGCQIVSFSIQRSNQMLDTNYSVTCHDLVEL